MLALGGKVQLTKDPFSRCKLADYAQAKSSNLAYCITQGEKDFTVWIGSQEDGQPSIVPASSEGLLGILTAYVEIAMTNTPFQGETLPEGYDLSLSEYEAMKNLSDRLAKERGFILPDGSEQSLFSLLAYMRFCSDTSRQDLETLAGSGSNYR